MAKVCAEPEKKPIELCQTQTCYERNRTISECAASAPPLHSKSNKSNDLRSLSPPAKSFHSRFKPLPSSDLIPKPISNLHTIPSIFPKQLLINHLRLALEPPTVGIPPALPKPWARFEWMNRLRVTKRGGRGLLVTTDDSFPPASEREARMDDPTRWCENDASN